MDLPPEAPLSWMDAVQLVELPAHEGRSARSAAPLPRRHVSGRVVRFLLIVLLPTLGAGLYFGLIAADRYISEARLMVRSAASFGRPAAPGLSVEEGPKAIGGDDAYAVREFMLSRDGMRLLLDKAGLREAVARGGRDLLWRFPSVLTGDTDEALFRLYGSLVSVDYQTTTGLIALNVQALRPEDARRMASVLIDGAEALVNRLNERARSDAIQVAEREVARSRDLALAAQERLTAFRQRESVVDPGQMSQTVMATITALSLQAVEAASQLDMTLHTSPNSPQIVPLRGRIRSLRNQIDQERGALAGGQGSFAPKIAEYERLLLDRMFAEKTFLSSLNLREAARADSQRQQSYLELVAEPRAADEAFAPYRVLWTIGVFLASLAAFWVFRPRARNG
jgi:capsular polysaccharide transport system permease protein